MILKHKNYFGKENVAHEEWYLPERRQPGHLGKVYTKTLEVENKVHRERWKNRVAVRRKELFESIQIEVFKLILCVF